MDAAELAHLADRFSFLLVGAALVVVAYLVNRFRTTSRKYVRRTAILYILYALALGVATALDAVGAHTWGSRLHSAAALLEVYTLVGLGGLFVFDLGLPALGLELVSITSDVVVGITYIVATIGVLRAGGMDLGSVVATSAVVSGVLALSLQATLGNILGGVALQIDGSIHVGDWIQLENGKQGKVREIRWRHTVVETRDWDTIVVPNASLLSSNITILGKRNGGVVPHRMWVYFHVDFRYPPQQVIEIVTDALLAAPIERVATDPKPNCVCMDLAKDGRESYGYYAVRYWLTDLAIDDPTSSVIRTRIVSALRRAGIPLARPSQTLFLTPDDESEQERRRERHREKRIAAVRSVELFKPLTDEEKCEVADRLRYAPFTRGETVTKQGAVAHWLYLLASGTVEIQARIDGVSHRVAVVESPGFFGEMGLMTGEPRTADVVASTDVECYRLDKVGLERIIQDRPAIAQQMSETLARRRVELAVVREGLDDEAQKRRQKTEQERILGRIQDFFGLS